MNVLVTGANGFIGSILCKKLIERGDRVRGLVRKTSDLTLLEGIPVQKIVGSLDLPDSLNSAVIGIELVYHVASAVSDWGSLEMFRRVNVEGTRNLLTASTDAGVKRFVYVSSVAIHSFIGAQDMNEDSPQLPTPFPYCQTKRETEALVMDAHRHRQIIATIVRPGDVFGPGDRTSLLKMAKLLETGKMAYIGGGKSLGAFTYVENLADGIILAGILEKAAGQIYIITDGIRLTWREYFEKLTRALDVPELKWSVHPSIAYVLASVLEFVYHLFRIQSRPPITRYLITHLRKDFHFSIEKAHRELEYEPRVDIDEAIQRTAAWYRKTVRSSNRDS
ncbi:NAD-dependent epimerase/dehydratase family protein [bacterium]|nr:NAD-dependent epimerase/dehydratase family protein [bacterium]